MAKALTSKMVEQIKPAERRREIPDGLLPSFYLLVQPSGTKGFAIRFRLGDRILKHTLGSWPDLSLAEARTAARRALEVAARGGDPRRKELTALLDPESRD